MVNLAPFSTLPVKIYIHFWYWSNRSKNSYYGFYSTKIGCWVLWFSYCSLWKKNNCLWSAQPVACEVLCYCCVCIYEWGLLPKKLPVHSLVRFFCIKACISCNKIYNLNIIQKNTQKGNHFYLPTLDIVLNQESMYST